MKRALLSLFLLASVVAVKAQPHCFVVGPAYNMGSTKITNYGFTRNTGTTADGAPMNSFSDFKDAKCKAQSAGILMDMYFKHCRFGMDIMVPFKNSQANFFNVNLAFGGYVKEKFGILVGLSGYANKKIYPTMLSDTGRVVLLNSDTYNSTGKYYYNAAPGSQVGANLLFTYALQENIVFRLDLGKYIATTESKKTPFPADEKDGKYEWRKKGSTKIELGGVWMISDKFGVFAKFNIWSTKGQLYAKNVEYTVGTEKKTVDEVNLTPEMKYSSKNFTFGIMIPLGSAESQSGTITVTPR